MHDCFPSAFIYVQAQRDSHFRRKRTPSWNLEVATNGLETPPLPEEGTAWRHGVGRPAEVISKNYGVCLRGCRSALSLR